MIKKLFAALLLPSFALAEPFIPFHLSDVLYQWQKPVSSLEGDMLLLKHPGTGTKYFWSHFFRFENSGEFGSNKERFGYMGLQTGTFEGGEDQAIFSLWNATAAEGANCRPFSGEGVGLQCLLPLKIRVSARYTFRLERLEENARGDLWQAKVSIPETGESFQIGKILSPPKSGKVQSSVLFSEYYGMVQTCAQIPSATIRFSALKGEGGNVRAIIVRQYPGARCASSSLTKITDDQVEISSGTLIR